MTVLPEFAFLSEKAPDADPPVITSPLRLPETVTLLVIIVAVVLPSYVLSDAVKP